MDIDELTRAIERLVPEPYISGYLEVVEYYKSACINRDEARKELVQCELSRTELIKQNSALAVENERLEVKLADSESGSISWRKSYHIALEKLVAAKAVIKAAQEQLDPEAEMQNFLSVFKIPESSEINWCPDRKLFLTPIPLWKKHAVGMTNALEGYIAALASHPVPAQSPVVAVPDWEDEAKRGFWTGLEIGATFGCCSILPRWNEYIAKRKGELAASHDRCPSHERDFSPAEFERQYEQVFHPIHAAYGVQDSTWLQDEAGKCADSCKDWPDWRKNAVTAEQDSGLVDHD